MEQSSAPVRTCMVCDQPKVNGIEIVSEFICDECEAEIVRTDVKDVKYPFFVHQLHKLWLPKDA